jgi:cell division protein FtsB
VRWLALGLFLLLLVLQYRLLFGEGSLAELNRLQAELSQLQAANAELRARNDKLELDVLERQRGTEVLEEKAREDLGMIGPGEVFYQDSPKQNGNPQ